MSSNKSLELNGEVYYESVHFSSILALGVREMNLSTDNIEKAIDDINPSKTLRSKMIKLIISITIWLIPEAFIAAVGAYYMYDKIYGKILFWGVVFLMGLTVLYLISRVFDLKDYRTEKDKEKGKEETREANKLFVTKMARALNKWKPKKIE